MISNDRYSRVGDSISARRASGERSTAEFLNDARKVLAKLKGDLEDGLVQPDMIDRIERTLSRYESSSDVSPDLRGQITAIKSFGRRAG